MLFFLNRPVLLIRLHADKLFWMKFIPGGTIPYGVTAVLSQHSDMG
jgi:hypothetical protein